MVLKIKKIRNWKKGLGKFDVFRLFWAFCCFACFVASGFLIRNSWENMRHNSISFAVNTNYLEWDSKFPAVFICESDNEEKVTKLAET